jgi:hypothetical protein
MFKSAMCFQKAQFGTGGIVHLSNALLGFYHFVPDGHHAGTPAALLALEFGSKKLFVLYDFMCFTLSLKYNQTLLKVKI